MRRVSYEEYLAAVALTLARRHRPVWSWQRWRRICRCGSELPCQARHRVPINRGHWPTDAEQREHRAANGYPSNNKTSRRGGTGR